MTNKPIKRFIAGAVCPRCSEMDKIVVFQKDGADHRECVSCGYTDVMHFQSARRELETRVNRTDEDKKEEVQVIRFPARPKDKAE